MGILDGIVEWIAEQIMYGLDMINASVLGALGCDMNTFLRYFPAAETMYSLLVALAIGLILLGWVWNLFKNYGLGLGVDAEDPVKLTAKAILFIVLAYYADEIVNIALTIGGTPYAWILSSELPSLDFASFNSVLLTIIGVCANGGVALIVLILTLILAWNYINLPQGIPRAAFLTLKIVADLLLRHSIQNEGDIGNMDLLLLQPAQRIIRDDSAAAFLPLQPVEHNGAAVERPEPRKPVRIKRQCLDETGFRLLPDTAFYGFDIFHTFHCQPG